MSLSMVPTRHSTGRSWGSRQLNAAMPSLGRLGGANVNVFGLGVLVDECHLWRLCNMENGEGRTDGVDDASTTPTFSPKSIAREERD